MLNLFMCSLPNSFLQNRKMSPLCQDCIYQSIAGEQRDTSATRIARELACIIHQLDTTRPITTGNNEPGPGKKIVESGAVDLLGYNYHNDKLATFQKDYPRQKFHWYRNCIGAGKQRCLQYFARYHSRVAGRHGS